MPVVLKERKKGGKKVYAVVERDTGETIKEYTDKDDARAYLQARNINYARGKNKRGLPPKPKK